MFKVAVGKPMAHGLAPDFIIVPLSALQGVACEEVTKGEAVCQSANRISQRTVCPLSLAMTGRDGLKSSCLEGVLDILQHLLVVVSQFKNQAHDRESPPAIALPTKIEVALSVYEASKPVPKGIIECQGSRRWDSRALEAFTRTIGQAHTAAV